MSTVASKWAWEADLPLNQKMVLLALADCHNSKTGQCNPRIETLAAKVGLSVRSIQYILKALKKAGYIAPIKRRKGRKQAANQYALALDGVVFQHATSCTLKTKPIAPCIIEPEVEPTRARPTNVVKVEFGAGNSNRIDQTTSVPQVDISRSAEKGKNRNRSG
jgi:DNA-binding transcriptional ArsR family regulator